MNRVKKTQWVAISLITTGLLSSTLASEWYNHKYRNPIAAHYINPEPLSKEERIDFSAIEAVLEDIVRQEIEAVTLNADLTPYLNRLTRPFLDQELTQMQTERLQHLLAKALPIDNNQHLGNLFTPFLHYQRIKRDRYTTNIQQPLSTAEALRIHKLLIPLRERILGKDISHELFNKNDHFTEYLLQRRLTKQFTKELIKSNTPGSIDR
jgi:hypothetical protein